MARYLFNVRDGRDVFDEVGTDLESLMAVRIHMVTTAANFLEQKVAAFRESTDWEMEAIDEMGKIVCTMTFSTSRD